MTARADQQGSTISNLHHNSFSPPIVIYAPHGVTDSLLALAHRTGFAIEQPGQAANEADKAIYQLFFDNNVLTLKDNTVTPAVRVAIDFCAGNNRHRQQFGGGLGQPLARAVNAGKLQHTDQMIADATGGFGRDAFVFASLGCRVVLLERSIVMVELLNDAIGRAQQDPLLAETAGRMQVYHTDSTQLPDSWPYPTRPGTVYLDPMYPDTGKSAAAKKDMQTLKRLLGPHQQGDDTNDTKLLSAALQTATQRVVVKRPKSAAPISGPKPVGEIKSANTRYDIYHPG